MKNTLDHEKRKSFVSTFTQTPPQFDTFTTTLKEVLDGEQKITELKYAAKKAESLVLGWIDFCDDIGFYAFHTYLMDIFEHWKPVIVYIRNMSLDAKSKNLKDLKLLWMQCNKNLDIPHAINICYEMQNEITQILSAVNADISQNRTKDLFQGQEEVFGSDEFQESIIEEETQEEKNRAFREAFLSAINKRYYFTSKGVPIPKMLFGGNREKLRDNENDW